MTAFPVPATQSSLSLPPHNLKNADSGADLFDALTPANRHVFITPSPGLPNASLAFAKVTLDAFAGKLGEEHAARLKEARRKRKRGEREAEELEVLKIRKVHIDGFEVEQVWEQAKRVIDALRIDAERRLDGLGEVSKNEEELNRGLDLLDYDEDEIEIGPYDEKAEEGAEPEVLAFKDVDESEEEDLDDALLPLAPLNWVLCGDSFDRSTFS